MRTSLYVGLILFTILAGYLYVKETQVGNNFEAQMLQNIKTVDKGLRDIQKAREMIVRCVGECKG